MFIEWASELGIMNVYSSLAVLLFVWFGFCSRQLCFEILIWFSSMVKINEFVIQGW